MQNLLIVDDEEYITNALYYFFMEQEIENLEIYKAYSAQEAIDLFNKIRFDIILSDICMPKMNGIELMNILKECLPSCRVIFFTGHQEFDYAYEALKYSGVSYVLKTEGYEKIKEVVENTLNSIDQSYKQINMLENWWEEKEKRYKLMANNYAEQILKGAKFTDNNVLFNTLHIDNNYLVCLENVETKIEEIAEYIECYLHDNIQDCEINFFSYYEENKIWVVFQFASVNAMQPMDWLFQIFVQIEKYLHSEFGISLKILIDSNNYNRKEINEAYQYMKNFDKMEENSINIINTRQGIVLNNKNECEAQINKLIQYINNNYLAEMSLNMAAEYMYFNPSYLSWLFKKQTGTNFQKYLNDVRIEKACELLSTSNKKITQVAKECGFGSSKYFISVFKKSKNMTPNEWRNNL